MTTSLQTPIPPPPPISVPVYSLATQTISDVSGAGLGTRNAEQEISHTRSSMNIVTFATPVSVKPRLYMISLYHGTKTKDTFFESKHGILQLLDKRQKDLVPLLGKRSGYEEDYDKEEVCQKAGFPWGMIRVHSDTDALFANIDGDTKKKKDGINSSTGTTKGSDMGSSASAGIRVFDGTKVLPRCQSYIAVKMIDTMEGGDHVLALCEVMGVGEWNDETGSVVYVQDVEPKDEESALYTGYLRKEGFL